MNEEQLGRAGEWSDKADLDPAELRDRRRHMRRKNDAYLFWIAKELKAIHDKLEVQSQHWWSKWFT